MLTEQKAFTQLLAWSADRPQWQRDALRRLTNAGTLTDEDIEELVALCLDPSKPGQPLSGADVSAQAGTGHAIALVQIAEPTGINALAPRQRLDFARTGLNIIYGDNGSGKSGYVRVLKHACRTRDRATGILRDIEDAAETPQTAAIRFARGEVEDVFDWTPAKPGHSDLPSISIFDSRSANVHVEKTNAVAYIPMPMQVLEALAAACDRVKTKLDEGISALTAKTPIAIKNPTLKPDTAAGAYLATLSHKSSLPQLDLLTKLSEADRQRLSTLEADLAQDPQRAAARLTGQKSRLDQQAASLGALVDAVNDDKFTNLERLNDEHKLKAEAARLASDALFEASPLPDIGKEAWRALWEAARTYSDTAGYPDGTFPDAIIDETLCVLCQQPLGAEAVERRGKFETFVKGTTKTSEEHALRAVHLAITSAASKRIPMSAIGQVVELLDTEIGDSNLAIVVRDCAVRAAWRLRAFARRKAAPCTLPEFPQAAIDVLSDALAQRAYQLAAGRNSPERLALEKELRELKDREVLAALAEDIRAEIGRCEEIEAINRALKDTNKRAITNKNKELSDQLVTSALRGRFAREIEKLKLSRMPVELRKTKDQSAVSFFQVCLVEKPNEPVGEIFSEGEHRCVALAAFLAELVTSKQYSGIVFDDPMSSLDHIHRRAVAARLVEEAAHRQVIVFTHDLAFLFELRREADAKNQPVHYQTVCRRQSRPGYVEDELPMKARSAWQLGQALRSELKAHKSEFDGWPDARRTVFSKGIFEQLREAWDQGIADFVFPVLGRFDNTIKGNSLFKLAVLDAKDVAIVTTARGRLSDEMHTSSETLNPATVSHADLLAEVVKLETWLTDIRQRQLDAKEHNS